ncbi:DUF5050 domain-containing protein [Candidatus Contubernalis alkaliaceticus]|uniref:DUF5050 domain-containing protein n=1 Tax=Candidatus Contubernalis alkaliaceticus TaxID=338645 RepID=UPI001F4BE8C6|nr:DUF5050 domain-containing protein [Candidatus Contubernalis alkalaceticus]UNC92238.1 DUF5050 domain-containing protein [Candidatus Contubernalis alkalaceticus]
MNLNYLCLGCLEDKGEALECPHCGFIEGTPPESPAHLPPGTILNEKLLIGRALGQGGFGITYLAWDMNLNIKLAIKEYYPQDLASRTVGQSQVSAYSGSLNSQYEYGLEKFLQEARTLAQFEDHPSIVSVRDYFQANQTAYIVMSYIEGVTLKGYLKLSGDKLPVDKAMNIIMPVLDALHEVHEINVLHRDVSPDNIFINRKGQVILIDFGAARQSIKDKGRSLSIILKPGFTPEEQYRSKGIQGPWTDIYATAATLYRMITGQMPPESLDRLEQDTLEPPSKLGVTIDENQERAILKAMAVRGADRFQTVREFQQALLGEAAVPPPELPSSGESSSEVQPESGPSPGEALKAKAAPPSKKPNYFLITLGVFGVLVLLGIISLNIISFLSSYLDGELISLDDKTASVENTLSGLPYDDNFTGPGEVQGHNQEQGLEVQKEVRGNTTGNIVNGAFVAHQGEWIYYSNPSDRGNLYKIKKDGSEYTRLNNDDSGYINVVGDWIYYSNYDDDNRIYKIGTDGLGRTLLSDYYWNFFISVVDNWVYFTGCEFHDDDYSNLYKMRTDGSELTILDKGFDGHFSFTGVNVVGDWIYYSDMINIYKIRLDGREKTSVVGDGAVSLNVVDDWIYYVNIDDDYTIYKITTDGSNRTRLNYHDSDSLNVYGDQIYFNCWEDDYSIYSLYNMRTDGSNLNNVYSDDFYSYLNVLDDWIYFVKWEEEVLYRISLDGSILQYFD